MICVGACMANWQDNRWAVGGIFAAVAGALVAAAIAFGGSDTPAQNEISPAGANTPASATTTTVGSATAPTTAPAAPNGPAADATAGRTTTTQAKPQQPVQQPAGAQETTEPPAPAPTTTGVPTTTGPATVAPARVPWCRDSAGTWRSGEGQGCTEQSPDFVEYR